MTQPDFVPLMTRNSNRMRYQVIMKGCTPAPVVLETDNYIEAIAELEKSWATRYLVEQ